MSGKQELREIKPRLTGDTPELERVETFMPSLEIQPKVDREYIQFLETRIRDLEALLALKKSWQVRQKESVRILEAA